MSINNINKKFLTDLKFASTLYYTNDWSDYEYTIDTRKIIVRHYGSLNKNIIFIKENNVKIKIKEVNDIDDLKNILTLIS